MESFEFTYSTRKRMTLAISFAGLLLGGIGGLIVWTAHEKMGKAFALVFTLIGLICFVSSLVRFISSKTWRLALRANEISWESPQENRRVSFDDVSKVSIDNEGEIESVVISLKAGPEIRVPSNCCGKLDEVIRFLQKHHPNVLATKGVIDAARTW